jgi:hypothetical protein
MTGEKVIFSGNEMGFEVGFPLNSETGNGYCTGFHRGFQSTPS